tara:strand:+ start:717 stop:2189 length:1473 start_codon:yes stop_codon:yes gene_type:complete
MAGYTRQSTYTDGDVIQASDSNTEFDQILATFNNSTGHAHDGTTAEGPIIGLIGDAGVTTPLNKLSVSTANDRFSFYVEVAAASVEQLRVEDGVAYPVTNNDIDLGTAVFMFKDGYFAGLLESVNLQVTNIKANDGTAAGSIADSTGVFTIASAVLTTADINGGTADNVTIGGTTAAAGSFTTLSATGNITVGGTVDGRDVAADGTKLDGVEALADVTDVTNVTAAGALMDSELTAIASVKALNQGVATTDSPTFVTINATTVNATTFDMTNLEVTNIKAKDGTASASIADTTGIMTVASSVLTTADINGGTIDGTTIGATTPAAVTTSSLVATTADINGGTIDATTIGATTPAAVTTSALVATTADINAGTVDAILGGTTPAAASVTTLTATGGGSLTGTWSDLGTVTTVDINGGTVDGAIIGGAAAAAGSFTSLGASGVLTADLSSISSTGDLAVSNGGTGASTAAAARTNLDVDQAGSALALAIALG